LVVLVVAPIVLVEILITLRCAIRVVVVVFKVESALHHENVIRE